ncbi:MAG: ATP-dependent DNA helicase RecG [Lachnospiraceae bacterium]|nr:ATP-dependent DNA helicase RecG [Lachnospiraceae bacterium]
MNLESPLDSLKGIGEKTKHLFATVGIETVGDLLAYYPRAYERYEEPVSMRDLPQDEIVTIRGTLTSPILNRYYGGKCISATSCTDGFGEVLLTWYNMPYQKNSLHTGETYIFRGKTKKKGKRLLIEQAAVFQEEQYEALTATLQPVYSLTKGMTVRMVQKAVKQALAALCPPKGTAAGAKTAKQAASAERTSECNSAAEAVDYLPENLQKEYHLCLWTEAVSQMHFPDDFDSLQTAHRRLAFDEFFFFLLQLQNLREHRGKETHSFHIRARGAADHLIASLPYPLTGAQKKVWADLCRELQGEKVMVRLIQGDVGSGKTILAVLALLTVAENGYQGALMAPTEVLAAQHYDSIRALLEMSGLPYKPLLLTGSMTARQKREAYAQMESGEASIVIGTHALIQEKAVYHALALVITDEQHRFGVRQRDNLAQKGNTPHTIVMSATPIPRTLAVILYGDLDISVLDEMPANRLPIKNCVVGPSWRPKAWEFIEKQVRLGHQAYVICPMVEESDLVDAENVIEYTETIRQALPADMRADYLHGRMKPLEKNEVMGRFLRNEIQVLVSTTVVEVGVNVPNATVMLIENAERFGLAQLHQLRGRVGRGDAQSYCIFLHGGKSSEVAERLDILNHSNDGFEIAAKDLQLRGPGDLFGVRQSGLMNFHLADVYADADILQLANEAVTKVMALDPELSLPEHRKIKAIYQRQKERQGGQISL